MKRTENIQFKATAEEKQIILDNANKANTDLSKYLRTVATGDGKVVFLDKGGYIPRNLIEINDRVKVSLRDGKISEDIGHQILSTLKDLMSKFIEISQQITTIENSEEDD